MMKAIWKMMITIFKMSSDRGKKVEPKNSTLFTRLWNKLFYSWTQTMILVISMTSKHSRVWKLFQRFRRRR